MSKTLEEVENYKPALFQKIWWPIERFLKNIPWNLKQIKFFWQRGRRGFADCDWWGMDYYLVSIILPMLKELRKNIHGHPVDLTKEKWDELLGEMIIGFEAANRVLEDDYYKEVSGDSIEAIRHATPKEIRKWGKLNWADQKLFHERMKLFNKHFFSLWD